MRTSDQCGELAAALAKAQGEMRPAIKDAQNPHLRNRYADLASCWDACREPLARNGLAVTQLPETADGAVRVTTRLMHASGQWVEADLVLPYGLCAMVGIAPDDDDDGANAGAKKRAEPKRETAEEKTQRQAEHDPSWPADQGRFMGRIAEPKIGLSYEDVCKALAVIDKPRPSAMTQEERDATLVWLERRKAKQQADAAGGAK